MTLYDLSLTCYLATAVQLAHQMANLILGRYRHGATPESLKHSARAIVENQQYPAIQPPSLVQQKAPKPAQRILISGNLECQTTHNVVSL